MQWSIPIIIQSDKEIRLNLQSAGFQEKITEFIDCYKQSEKECEIKLLSQQRNLLLDEIHDRQVRIDRLDYMLYQIKKDKK